MKFLVAGLGSIGQRHIKNLSGLRSCDILAYRVRKRTLDGLVEKYNVKTYVDLEEALDQKPDSILVTNPTSHHIPVAISSARRGCHLFIEKPLSDQLDGTDELERLVGKKNLVCLIGCNFRFHPGLGLVKKLLDDQEIGKVISARIQAGEYLPDWHPEEDYREGYSARKDLGGGVILTLIHELDYAYWFFGKPAKVFCFADKLSKLDIDVEDTAEILMKYPDGNVIEIHLDYIQRTPSRSCQIIGEKGTILWDYHKNLVELFTAKSGMWKSFPGESDFERNQMFVDEMRHFLSCIEGKEKSLISLRDGKEVLKIALAVKESAKTGIPVELNHEK
jgi:predicted dehydrogenase